MPLKTRTPKTQRHQLTGDQEMELWLGPSRRGSAFTDRTQAQWGWQSNRDRLMQRYACGGRHPLAWWRFEAGELRYPGHDRERSTLYAAGLLTADARRELLAWWRQEFETAQQDGFTFCQGPGLFLRGIEARRAHFAWADVPAELVEQWSAEQVALVSMPLNSR